LRQAQKRKRKTHSGAGKKVEDKNPLWGRHKSRKKTNGEAGTKMEEKIS
jgi:hypothetical protein